MATPNPAWHTLSTEETANRLDTDIRFGLSEQEAGARLETHGRNELAEAPPPSFLARLLRQLSSFVVLLLLVAAVVSALLGDVPEAAAIMAIVILNAVLGVVQEGKAEESLAALKKMTAPTAEVVRGGQRMTAEAPEVVPGDIVVLDAGDYVPADLRLIETANLRVEEAALTGESVPEEKDAQHPAPQDASPGDRTNCAFMGTVVTYGRGRGIVTATGMGTEIGRIAEMLESYGEAKTPLQKKLDQLGRSLGMIAVVICALVFLVVAFRDTDPGLIFRADGGLLPYFRQYRDALAEVFIVAVSLAIAAVPEGLPAVVTICLALGMKEMVKRNALIRKLPAVETLGSATIICSDKTGTLTQNRMTVVRLWADGDSVRTEDDAIEISGRPVLETLLRAGALCNDAAIEETQEGTKEIGDPTEIALVAAARRAGLGSERLSRDWPRVGEVPFDSDRKRMTTIHRIEADEADRNVPGEPGSYALMVKGAPDLVLERCDRLLTAEGTRPLNDEDRERISSANKTMAGEALRVLAAAYRVAGEAPESPGPEIEDGLVFAGLFGMIDPARPEVASAIARARRAGIRTAMITGDYPETARAIARDLRLLRPEAGVMTGAEIEALDDEQLSARAAQTDVFARVSPQHKVRIVDAFRRNGHVVAMTGDGVNDAPALKRADIGIAMGITGTDVSKQAAHMVLTDDNYVSIVGAVEQGRIIYANIRKFVAFLLSCNFAEVTVIFVSALLGWPIPLTAIQILWLNLLSDGAPALALGLEKGEPDIMEQPPRPPKEPVINRFMLGAILTQTVALSLSVLGAYWFSLSRFGGDLDPARTVAFSTLVMAELFRAYTARSERLSLFRLGVFSNRTMQYAVALSLSLLLIVVYLPVLQPAFGTVALAVRDWLFLLPFAVFPSVVAEIWKVVTRRRRARSRPHGRRT